MILQELETIRRDDLKDLPEVKKQRPPPVGYCHASIFEQYEGTNSFQWWAHMPSAHWKPYGEVLVNLDS